MRRVYIVIRKNGALVFGVFTNKERALSQLHRLQNSPFHKDNTYYIAERFLNVEE